ncbi:MAG: YigZ family protein [Peptococcaceae bacterium]|jgi:uncharacterized YigZ family protein|nr:YigZ family protein [Peptococcaceae bacterium]
MLKSYKTLQNMAQDEFIVEKSKFIGHGFPVSSKEEALAQIESLQKKYWNASHNAWAYIVDSNSQRFSDGGEPQGTAGIPILEALKKEQLTHTAVVVTRYFGGVKLGAGGLTRAYAKGARIAVLAGRVITRVLHLTCFAEAAYPFLNPIQKELARLNIIIHHIQYTEKVRFVILVAPEQEKNVTAAIMEASSGSAVVTKGEFQYVDMPDESL